MTASIKDNYERLIIYRIEKLNIPFNEKCNLLTDFCRNNRKYYELLCDYSYLLSVNNSNLSMWMSLNGKPHLSLNPLSPDDIKVLDQSSVPLFDGDLIECLNVVLHNLVKNH